MTPHILCYQGLAVDDYDFALDASNLRYPQLSIIWDIIILMLSIYSFMLWNFYESPSA